MIILVFAIVMSAIAALASALRGERDVHQDEESLAQKAALVGAGNGANVADAIGNATGSFELEPPPEPGEEAPAPAATTRRSERRNQQRRRVGTRSNAAVDGSSPQAGEEAAGASP